MIVIPTNEYDNNSGKILNIGVVYQLMNNKGIKKVLILENIRSVYNVGAIFRTADAIGIDIIYLVGTTPSPIDRFGRERSDLHKSALGAEKSVEWEYVDDVNALNIVSKLKDERYVTCALEQDERSVEYNSIQVDKDIAIVVGNEVDGVSKEILDEVDNILEIPMKGDKESLNVSVAAGVMLFGLFD
jgi:23S rRNA (guanosine2251-2'-O)-methyltransferase